MVVYQGKIATSNKKVFLGQIKISDTTGLIEEVTDQLVYPASVVYNDDCLIFAGFGDVHIHAREDQTGKQTYKEEYSTCSRAALNGGVVQVSAMPNTPKPLTTLEDLIWHKARLRQLNLPVTVVNYVGVGNGTRPIEIKVPYKAYTGPSVGELFFKSESEFKEAIKHYSGLPVSFHVEDFDVLSACRLEKTHSKRRPVRCVETALKYVLSSIEEHNINAKLCHWSTAKHSLEMIAEHRDKMAKKELGYNTQIEVSPLHLMFDTQMTDRTPELWGLIQMNPAIQDSEHRFGLIQALRTGEIDYLATDHAPHTEQEKFKIFTRKYLDELDTNIEATGVQQYTNLTVDDRKALRKIIQEHNKCSAQQIAKITMMSRPGLSKKAHQENGTSGAPWLDTYSIVCAYLMDEHNFTPAQVSLVASENPGNFVNQFLDSSYGFGFGKIEKGYQGSLSILNIKKIRTVLSTDLQTRVRWSPLQGKRFTGSLEAVIVRGIDQTIKS